MTVITSDGTQFSKVSILELLPSKVTMWKIVEDCFFLKKKGRSSQRFRYKLLPPPKKKVGRFLLVQARSEFAIGFFKKKQMVEACGDFSFGNCTFAKPAHNSRNISTY